MAGNEELTELTKDLLSGEIDETLLEFDDHIRNADRGEVGRGTDFMSVRHLLCFVLKRSDGRSPKSVSTADACRSRSGPKISRSEDRPHLTILKLLARLGLEDQVFAYISRFTEPCFTEKALAHEILQVACLFEHPMSWQREDTLLLHFREAQMIRDRNGIERQDSPPTCFRSLEEVIRLEEEIREGCPSNLMVQCVALGLASRKHICHMYASITTHSQLEAFHEGACRLCSGHNLNFEEEYDACFRRLKNSTPTWSAVRTYLELSFHFNPAVGTLFGAEIPKNEVDGALRSVLKYLERCFGTKRSHIVTINSDLDDRQAATQALKLVLDRAPSLEFREMDHRHHRERKSEFRSSLTALLHFLGSMSSLPVSEFLPYICCPLKTTAYTIAFDERRPAKLCCLAARSEEFASDNPHVPDSLRAWVLMHQELKDFVEKYGTREKQIDRLFLLFDQLSRCRGVDYHYCSDSDPGV